MRTVNSANKPQIVYNRFKDNIERDGPNASNKLEDKEELIQLLELFLISSTHVLVINRQLEMEVTSLKTGHYVAVDEKMQHLFVKKKKLRNTD